ncbi:MAG: dockerin type I domain-containing protein [Planctomycetota bacterium]
MSTTAATVSLTALLALSGAAWGQAQSTGLLGGPAAGETTEARAGESFAQGDRQQRARGDRGRRHHRPDRAAMLERFDADGDGELSDGERETAKAAFEARRAEMKAKLLERFDDNGDGELDEAERAELRAVIGPMIDAERRREGSRKDRMRRAALERFDADGDGALSDDERALAKQHFQQKKAELVERFDADGSGDLNGEERREAGRYIRERRMLDANRDGRVDALDAQVITERAAAGERLPDINRDGERNAIDAAELIERIGRFDD